MTVCTAELSEIGIINNYSSKLLQFLPECPSQEHWQQRKDGQCSQNQDRLHGDVP